MEALPRVHSASIICSYSFVNLGLAMCSSTTCVCHATTTIVVMQQFFCESFRSRHGYCFSRSAAPERRLTQEETTPARCPSGLKVNQCYEEPGGRVPLSAGAW